MNLRYSKETPLHYAPTHSVHTHTHTHTHIKLYGRKRRWLVLKTRMIYSELNKRSQIGREQNTLATPSISFFDAGLRLPVVVQFLLRYPRLTSQVHVVFRQNHKDLSLWGILIQTRTVIGCSHAVMWKLLLLCNTRRACRNICIL
jgi:hypothetical protein